jgi:hypothetical protein
MKKAILIFLIIGLSLPVLGNDSFCQDLVKALISVESNGDVNAIGDKGRAVGCLQIWKIVIDDVNNFSKKKFKYSDRFDFKKSVEICKEYLRYWGKHYEKVTGKKIDAFTLARIWNGGPNGFENPKTLKYAKKVMAKL